MHDFLLGTIFVGMVLIPAAIAMRSAAQNDAASAVGEEPPVSA